MKKSNIKQKTYKILDIFSGAGGMSLGFESTKRFISIGAVDSWEPACETYTYNHPELNPDAIVNFDITKIFNPREKSNLFSLWNVKKGDIDVILGGPPCQGMSLAGKRLSDDPRNMLFRCFVEMVRLLQPKIFVMENVPGLLSTGHGNINSAILDAFKEIKYNHFDQHKPEVLKAECYGVPQIRRRLFYVGFRPDIPFTSFHWPPTHTHLSISANDYDSGNLFSSTLDYDFSLKPSVTVSEAISDLPYILSGEGEEEMEYPVTNKKKLSSFQKQMRDWSNCPYSNLKPKVYNHVAPKHTKKLIDMIKKAKPGESVDPKYTDSKMWHPDKPGYTVKALGAGGGSTNRRAFHYDSNCPRASTVRENARIQSFPDWYHFMGAKTHQMSQVGNAVPPILAKVIAESLLGILDKK